MRRSARALRCEPQTHSVTVCGPRARNRAVSVRIRALRRVRFWWPEKPGALNRATRKQAVLVKDGPMRNPFIKSGFGRILVLAFFLLGAAGLFAQENAAISGSVTDATGAVIPNAKITITNVSTGDARTMTSNAAGLYDFAGLNHGIYNLTVDAQGFKLYEKTGIVVNVASTTPANVVMEIGASSQTVTVEANALHLQTESNEVSNLITGEQITQLATNGRNMVSLTTLGTGVSTNINSFNGVTAQGSGFGLSFNGMRPDHNNWLIDGGEAYDRGSGGKFDLMPTPDILAEFQVLSSNYSPDYGISSGGTVTMAIKSGSKDFHGAAWEFNRNDAFDAAHYFAKQNKQAAPELRLNIFGFAVGGPAFIPGLYPRAKSKTYFFESEEWRRYIAGANPTSTATVPETNFPTAGKDLNYVPWNVPASLAAGVCNEGVKPCVPITSDPDKLTLYSQLGLTPGGPFKSPDGGKTLVIPSQLLDPNAVLFMGTGAIPHPTGGTADKPLVFTSPKQPTFVREDVVRIDHDITDKYHLMGHWIHDQMSQTNYPSMWSGASYYTVGTVFANPSWASVIKLTQTLTPNLLNETSLNVNGNKIQWTPVGIYNQPAGWDAQSLTGFDGNKTLKELPAVAFSGALNTTWTLNYNPWHNAFLDYQGRDDLSWNVGRHGLKFGFSYMRMAKNQQQQALVQGTYNFGSDFSGDSYLNFLLGFADQFTQLKELKTPHWLNNTYSFYAMDNWHLAPRVTLNLGIRYDAMPHVFEKNNRVSNFNPALFSGANAQIPDRATGQLNPNGPGVQTINGTPFYMNGIALAGQNGTPRGLVENDFKTIQPRLGFAYDLTGRGTTIVRAGGGFFYERIQGNDIYGLSSNAPFAVNAQVNGIYFSNPNKSASTGDQARSPLNPTAPGSINHYYPNPGTAQFSLGIQQQVQPSIVSVLQYVGSIGWNQNNQRHINTLPLSDFASREAVAANSGLSNQFRMFPGFAGIQQTESRTNANYHSLQAGLRIENKHNLSAQFSYTWSHQIDIASGDMGSTNMPGGQSFVSNPFNLRYDRGSGVLDRRHIFSANYDYKMPYLGPNSTLARAVLGGWEISGVTTAQSGTPRQIYYNGADTLGLGGGTVNRPNLAGSTKGPKSQTAWFKTSAFSAPTAPWAGGSNNGFGSAGKDAVVGPGLFNWNLALFKSFNVSRREGTRLEFRVETFNTFNHTQFQNLDTNMQSKTFGQATSTYDPRVLQFGGKFLF
ncbi:hypothetical protein DYQ86_19620 [Acidobacteria bacterium AB60]|nr:hypothetical protein DYQ86_19620 [Acidobacteria bacterium AB60]